MKPTTRSPWAWIPTLYFAEGLPYFAVMSLAVIMYQNMGLSDKEVALYTSWLGTPWIIKPLWSPFIDLLRTKRFWVLAMQGLMAAAFACIAFFLPTSFFVQATMACFALMAFASATHDIAADGYYMLALSSKDQSFFVGLRNTFYRCGSIFGQGVLVMLAGLLADGHLIPSIKGNVALAWALVFYLLCAIFIGLFLYHSFAMPKVEQGNPRETSHGQTEAGSKRAETSNGQAEAGIKQAETSNGQAEAASAKQLMRNLLDTAVTFFRKPHIGTALFFILTYRLGESQLGKIAPLFVLASPEKGGLGLSTTTVGGIYGTLGVIALLLGGIVAGIMVSRKGLKYWILPMALAINVPDLLYVLLAWAQWTDLWVVGTFVAIEQFGYGIGFAAYMLYLIHFAQGPYKTAHYALATGLMAAGMSLPGMIAGYMSDWLGYTNFFIFVCLCTLPGIIAALVIRKQLPASFGKEA